MVFFHIGFEEVEGDMKVIRCESKFEGWMWFKIWTDITYIKYDVVMVLCEDWA